MKKGTHTFAAFLTSRRVLAALILCACFLFSSDALALDAGDTLRVMTFNVRGCKDMTDNVNVQQTANRILTENPDVCGIQECNAARSAALAAATGLKLFFANDECILSKAHEKIVSAATCPKAKKDANGVLRDDEFGFPMKELRAKSPWNYALVADGTSGELQFDVKGEGLERRLSVKAVRTDYAGWGRMSAAAPARAIDPPPSPVPAAARGDVEMIELVPIALTQLRITLFPWTR